MTDPTRELPREIVVLYIGGEGRSGSTLLAAMLGEYAGFLPVGELRGIWQAVKTNELCGCGLPFNECEFWARVGETAFGGWERVDVAKMLRFDNDFARHRFLPRLLIPSRRRKHFERIAAYAEILRRVYASVVAVSGCSVIVDSTKDPPYAFLLSAVPGLDLRVAHLIRDSRGVAFSWGRAVTRPEYAQHSTLTGTFMERRKTWRSALLWDAKNLLVGWLGRSGVPYVLVKYESLVSDTASGLADAVSVLDARSSSPFTDDSRGPLVGYESLPHHTLGGNRIRFSRGTVELQADDEWRSAMARRERLLVTLLTLPLLLAYGYLGPRRWRAYASADHIP